MDHLRRQHRDSAVPMFLVVPSEKPPAPAQGVLLAAKAVREPRPVLESLEVTLRKRVVVGGMRTAVALGHTKVGQELPGGLRLDGRPAVGVDGKLVGLDALLGREGWARVRRT